MTEPEQWAEGVWSRACATQNPALTIQRAFEERERELREALEQIAALGRGPVTMTRIARQALATRQDAPVMENSHDH